MSEAKSRDFSLENVYRRHKILTPARCARQDEHFTDIGFLPKTGVGCTGLSLERESPSSGTITRSVDLLWKNGRPVIQVFWYEHQIHCLSAAPHTSHLIACSFLDADKKIK